MFVAVGDRKSMPYWESYGKSRKFGHIGKVGISIWLEMR